MEPGIDLRIRTMIKAMTEVVLPAVDPANGAAQDQARLVIGSLDMLIDQIDHAHWYEVADVRANHALATALIGLPGTSAGDAAHRVLSTALATAGRHEVTLSELRTQNRLVRDVIDDLICSVDPGNAAALADVMRSVLQHGRRQVARERAFVAKARFDNEPDTLLGIRESLEQAG